MTNREKILKTNIYDLMMTIANRLENGDICPIKLISGQYNYSRCKKYSYVCGQCIQKWLNQEADQPKPQWQDAMMKNFLRKE